MWVKFLRGHTVERRGEPRRYNPGDWADFGRQYAMYLVSAGIAEATSEQVKELLQDGDTGVLAVGRTEYDGALLGDVGKQVGLAHGDPATPWRRTLLWDRKARLPVALLPVGFSFLDAWEAACPLLPYETLAANLGDERDRCRTMETVHELRVPVYEPGLLFLRRCANADALLRQWAAELVDGGDRRLAFLRALYRTPMLMLALPPTWLEPRYRAEEG